MYFFICSEFPLPGDYGRSPRQKLYLKETKLAKMFLLEYVEDKQEQRKRLFDFINDQ